MAKPRFHLPDLIEDDIEKKPVPQLEDNSVATRVADSVIDYDTLRSIVAGINTVKVGSNNIPIRVSESERKAITGLIRDLEDIDISISGSKLLRVCFWYMYKMHYSELVDSFQEALKKSDKLT